MSSRAARLSDALERVQRQRAAAELTWLRRGQLDQEWVSGARRLLSDEGAEQLDDARRERVWTQAEERGFVAQRAQLAFALEFANVPSQLAGLVFEPYALPFGREPAVALVRNLMGEGDHEGREHRARALAEATGELAPRFVELRMRALQAHAAQLRAAPATTPEETPPSPTAAEVARDLLANTDDAAREMTRWLVRPHAQSGTIPWHVLWRALRAPDLDGLAKHSRRLARVATGLRGLGFERDLNSRVRADAATAVFDPRPRVVVVEAPSDIRVVQSSLAQGVVSDVYAAHGVGHGLALALASPALPALLRRSPLPGVADALGMTYMQLRADREYLRRIDGIEPLVVERVARHAGILVLLEVRLQAALATLPPEIRRESEWTQQITAAVERALCVELPVGLAVLASAFVPPGSAAFEACATGLAVHDGLRERFDSDWYRNPRVSEVLRGAAARGSTLELSQLRSELNVPASRANPRLIELLS